MKRPPRRWREVVATAKVRGYFTEIEKRNAKASWQTCAVGEHHQAMPQVVCFEDNWPVDLKLQELGSSAADQTPKGFGYAVATDDFDAAESRLDDIDDRVLQLKREHLEVPHGEAEAD